MKEKLRAADYRFLVICLTLFVAATWFSAGNFYRAFPEASIDFRVSREGGLARAASFLEEHRYAIGGYREASSFTFDDDAKTFLERAAGLEQANRLMSTRVHLWRWSYRWFRPQQKEEFRADITPAGEFAGFSHEIAEDASRAALTLEQARAAAEEFLRVWHRDPASLEFVESSDVARPHRTDRVFTWKERDFNLRESTLRYEVTMLGDEVGAYREYLKIPEQWSRDYQRLRSRNGLAQQIDTAVMLALLAGLLVVIVMRVARQDVRWGLAAAVGCIGMALAFFAQLNEMPLHEFGYPTTDSYGSFLSRELLNAVIGALGAGGLLFVLTAGAEPMYRSSFGGQVAVGNLFRARSLRTKRFFLGSILGITLTAIFIAYQTGFYITAYKFGAWSPADVQYSDLLNTRFPWLYVLFGGFLPAVSEEFLFRLFAIPFLKKLTRWMPAAIVLAGFIWGFGHSSYPQQPFFIRGLEVGLGGVALGLVMLRWGILPTLVWHYSVDAMYSAMLLLRSHSLYFQLSGAASAGIILLPVAAALVAYWRRGGFEPAAGLLNRDEPTPPEPTAAAVPATSPGVLDYRPLTARARFVAGGIFVAGLCALLIPASHLGERPTYKLSAEKARGYADAFLRVQGLDPNSFRHVTYPASRWEGNDEVAGKYFLERKPVEFVSRLFEGNRTLQLWSTRYFRPNDKEEVQISVHPETGQVQGFQHTLAEDAPGADITSETAREIAARVAAARGWDLASMVLKESSSEKLKARRDHSLVWEAPEHDPRNVDQARFRVYVEVSGDRVTTLRSFWKVPEAYERGRSQRNFLSILVLTLRIVVIAYAIVRGIWMTIHQVRAGLVRWRTVLRIAIPATLLMAISALLSRELMLQGYRTEVPFGTFQAITYISALMGAIGGLLMFAGAAALVTSFYPESTLSFRAAARRLLAADALFAVLAAAGLRVGLGRLVAVLNDGFHAQALFSIEAPTLIASAAPAITVLADATRSVIVGAAVIGACVLIVQGLPRTWMRISLGLLAAFVILPIGVQTPGEFAVHYAYSVVVVAAATLFCARFARRNCLAYALALWTFGLVEPLTELFATGNGALQVQGWIVAAALVLSLVWALAPATAAKRSAASAAA